MMMKRMITVMIGRRIDRNAFICFRLFEIFVFFDEAACGVGDGALVEAQGFELATFLVFELLHRLKGGEVAGTLFGFFGCVPEA